MHAARAGSGRAVFMSIPPGCSRSTAPARSSSAGPRHGQGLRGGDGADRASRRGALLRGPPAGRRGLCAQAAAVRVRGRRRLRAARALRAAARPPCSTSSPGCWCPAKGGCCSTAATSRALAPAQRNIAQVFQFPVIYDTMTVAREPGLPAAQPRRAPRPRSGRGWPRSRPCSISSR